jgi:LPXTG-motif cell wall-anchored protein
MGITGHAYAASNFPAPGGVFNGLTMGAVIGDNTMPILVAVIAIVVVLVAVLLFLRKKRK